MIIVFDKEILIKFLHSLSPSTKNADAIRLIQVFINKDNKLAVTRNLINRIEREIVSSPDLTNLFQGFLKDTVDNNRITNVNVSFDDEIEELLQEYTTITTNEVKFIIIGSKKTQLSRFGVHLNRTCIFSDIKKPNRCWTIFNIISNFGFTVRYSDFKSNKEIEDFFEHIFSLIDKGNEILILDSYCNLHRHSLFDSIRKKGYTITVYTSSIERDTFAKNKLRIDVKEYFGKSSTSIKFSSDKRLLHERTFTFGDYVIESNHDFAEIRRENRNWKIDVSHCSMLKAETLDKCNAYN